MPMTWDLPGRCYRWEGQGWGACGSHAFVSEVAPTHLSSQAMPRGGVAFYNCGPHSGRSQPHKHLQVWAGYGVTDDGRVASWNYRRYK